jgi:hypothetical protein
MITLFFKSIITEDRRQVAGELKTKAEKYSIPQASLELKLARMWSDGRAGMNERGWCKALE